MKNLIKKEKNINLIKKYYFPNIKMSVILLIFCEIILFFIPSSKNLIITFFRLVFTSIFIPFIFYLFSRKYYKKNVFNGMFKGEFKIGFIFYSIIIMIGVMIINYSLSSLLQPLVDKSSSYMKFIEIISSNKLLLTLFILPIVFLAPLGEELVFRGIILRGISSNHKAITAITISAFLFSIAHLDLAQIPNAFVLGFIFSVLVIHSKNLFYSIFYHFINNLLVSILLFFVDFQEIKNEKINIKTNLNFQSVIFYIFLIFLAIFIIYLGLKLTIKYITEDNRKVIPSDEVYNDYLDSFNSKPNM